LAGWRVLRASMMNLVSPAASSSTPSTTGSIVSFRLPVFTPPTPNWPAFLSFTFSDVFPFLVYHSHISER
jgi:hypothetical protein